MIAKRCRAFVAALLVVSFAALYGCGQGGGTNGTSAQESQYADVSVKAVFPSAGAVKSLIPAGTTKITVSFYGSTPNGYISKQADLTPESPSQTVKLPPGDYSINASAYDSNGMFLANTYSYGTVILGQNNVTLTFLNGEWTFVDASGNASPIVLSDNTTSLGSFVISNSYGQSQVKPASKSYEGMSLRFRFNNDSSARTSYSNLNVFKGTANSSTFSTGMYNVTRKCAMDNYSGCTPANGDRMVMIPDSPYYNSENFQSGRLKMGNASAVLPNKGKTLFTRNGATIDIPTASITTTITGASSMSGNLLEVVLTSDPTRMVKTASTAKVGAKAVKSQSTNTGYTGLTVADYQYIIYSTKSTPNKGTWSLYNPKTDSAGKTYYESGYITPGYSGDPPGPTPGDPGDYSYGLVPKDTSKLGEYCHELNTDQKTCKTQAPPATDIYYPYRFYDFNGDGVIDYGSFYFQFYLEEAMSGNFYLYPFTLKGK